MISGEQLKDFLEQAAKKGSKDSDIIEILNLTKVKENSNAHEVNIREVITILHEKFIDLLIQNNFLSKSAIQHLDLNDHFKLPENYLIISKLLSEKNEFNFDDSHYFVAASFIYFYYFHKILSRFTLLKEFLNSPTQNRVLEDLTHTTKRFKLQSQIKLVCEDYASLFENQKTKRLSINRENIIKNFIQEAELTEKHLGIQIVAMDGMGKTELFLNLLTSPPIGWHMIEIDFTLANANFKLDTILNNLKNYENIKNTIGSIIIIDNYDCFINRKQEKIDEFINKINSRKKIVLLIGLKNTQSKFCSSNYENFQFSTVYLEPFSLLDVNKLLTISNNKKNSYDLFKRTRGYPQLLNCYLENQNYRLSREIAKDVFDGLFDQTIEDVISFDNVRNLLLRRFFDYTFEINSFRIESISIRKEITKRLFKNGVIQPIDSYLNINKAISTQHLSGAGIFVPEIIRFLLQITCDEISLEEISFNIIEGYKTQLIQIYNSQDLNKIKKMAFIIMEITYQNLVLCKSFFEIANIREEIFKLCNEFDSENLYFDYLNILSQDKEIMEMILGE